MLPQSDGVADHPAARDDSSCLLLERFRVKPAAPAVIHPRFLIEQGPVREGD